MKIKEYLKKGYSDIFLNPFYFVVYSRQDSLDSPKSFPKKRQFGLKKATENSHLARQDRIVEKSIRTFYRQQRCRRGKGEKQKI